MALIDGSRLFDSPFQPGINEDAAEAWVAFVVNVEVRLPGNFTKRWEGIRYLQNKALRTEADLRASTSIRVQGPIAFKPALGQKSAALTLNGFYLRTGDGGTANLAASTAQPYNNTTIIHSGTDVGEKTAALSRPGLYNPAYNTTTTALRTEADAFLSALVAATSQFVRADINYLNFSGVRFGRGFHNMAV